MHHLLQSLVRPSYPVLFAFVFAEQMGIPIPSAPVLMAAGALAGTGRLSLVAAILVAVLAAMVADAIWYVLGWFRGHAILKLLCRISLEPDSCVRRTENAFAERGGRVLLFSKFVPGLGAAAMPLAGMLRMTIGRFLAWESAGALIWAGSFAVGGFLFSRQIERAIAMVLGFGSWLGLVVILPLAGYLGWKYYQRQKFLRDLRIARITPEDLKRKLDAGENLAVIDLRHAIEFDAEGVKVPGAIHIDPQEIETRHVEIPRDRDVVLYCT
ncbi:MAG TPA: VTT domain-containing protein [Terriglobia bacterium]|nr:VTT domain-containing protein [Terriglobia bacterium]